MTVSGLEPGPTVAGMRPGIISLQPKAWNDHFRSSHYIMTRLARRWPVVWIDPPHDRRGVAALGRTRQLRFRQPVDDRPLYAYTAPAGLPVVDRPPSIRRALERARLFQAARQLKRCGCDRVVLYCWNPRFLESTELIAHDLLLYHIVDEYSYSPDDPPTSPQEQAMIRRADQVIVHSRGLVEKKRPLAPARTAFVPNGVDFEAFSAPGPEPAELAGIPRPRIGYCGVLKRQLDWALLQALVKRHRDWHWVFVGHWQEIHTELASMREWMEAQPNIHLIGRVPAPRLSEFPAHFDVGVMPYVSDGYTKYIYPLKLHEYLAAGIPVVGTPIRTLADFQDVVLLARSEEGWSAALETALSPASRRAEIVQERRAVARAHDWGLLTDRIAGLIEQRLAQEGEGRISDSAAQSVADSAL